MVCVFQFSSIRFTYILFLWYQGKNPHSIRYGIHMHTCICMYTRFVLPHSNFNFSLHWKRIKIRFFCYWSLVADDANFKCTMFTQFSLMLLIGEKVGGISYIHTKFNFWKEKFSALPKAERREIIFCIPRMFSFSGLRASSTRCRRRLLFIYYINTDKKYARI